VLVRAQTHVLLEARTNQPVLRRPKMPVHWQLKKVPSGIVAFDAALMELQGMADGNSLPCRLRAEARSCGATAYVVLLTRALDNRCRSIAHRLSLQFKRNTGSRLGIPFTEWQAYADDLLDYWRNAHTRRSESIRWLDQQDLPYVEEPHLRSIPGYAVVPSLRVVVANPNLVMRIELADKGEWASTPYRL